MMSISFNFARLQNYGRDFSRFVVTKATDAHQFLASKNIKMPLGFMPKPLRIAALSLLVLILITAVYKLSVRRSDSIDLTPNNAGMDQPPQVPQVAVPEVPNPNQPGSGSMDNNMQVGIIPANQPVQNKQVAKPQPKVFPVNVIQVPQLECKESKTKLMMFVYSRPENSGEREAIRKSWGRMENSLLPQDVQLWKIFFVMGRSYTEADQAVAQENMVEKDILMGEFLDTPFEDTRKFMMTMRWFTLNSKPCQPKFVMRTQDNVFHNMQAIMGWIEGRFENRPVTTSNLYLGKILRMDRPIRDPNHALFVPVQDYNREMFPEFIQSPVYFLTYQTFVRMSLIMMEVIPIAMEDAYVGLLAEKVGLKPTHNDHFHMMSKTIDLCHHLKMFFIFNVLPTEHDSIFQQLKESIQKPECQAYKDADYF